jgi:uncharacterized OB-fold protein
MVICANCGEHNGDGVRFCGRCNSFLEWAGATEEQPVATTVAAATAEAIPTAAPPAPTAPPPTEPSTPVTVAQPSEQVVRAPRRTAPTPQPPRRRAPAPGERICGQCGEGNVPTRQFCRRCGMSLAEVEPERLSWWRRLLAWLRAGRRRETVASRLGHTDRLRKHNRAGRVIRRGIRWARNIVLAAIAVGAVGYAIYPPLRHTVNADAAAIKAKIAGEVPKFVPLHADKVTASLFEPSHPGELVNDNNTASYWQAPTNGTQHPSVTLSFDHRADVARMIVFSGIGNDFQAERRPKTLHFVYSTGKTENAQLTDTPDPQQVTLRNGNGATSVEIVVTDYYLSPNGGDVAISEIELFEQQ